MIRTQTLKQVLLGPTGVSAPFQVNEAFYRLEATIAVVNSTSTSPPASPTIGDAYLITSTPSGPWTGLLNYIVFWYGGIWHYIPPREGMRTFDSVKEIIYEYDGSAWIGVFGHVNLGGRAASFAPNMAQAPSQLFSILNSLTLNLPTNMVAGRTYYIVCTNTSGLSRNLVLQAGSWVVDGAGSTIAIANNAYKAITFMKDFKSGSSRAMICRAYP